MGELSNAPTYIDALKSRGLNKVRVGETRHEPADIYYKVYGNNGKEKVVLVMGLGGRADMYVDGIC